MKSGPRRAATAIGGKVGEGNMQIQTITDEDYGVNQKPTQDAKEIEAFLSGKHLL
jgi:hypothetical protein